MLKKLIGIAMFVPLMAHAEFYSGNDLYMKMTDETSLVNRMAGMGYVVGVYDVAVYLYFCPPKPESSVTVGQITDMVKNWLAINANRRNELAYNLVTEVFKRAWPCPTNRTNPSTGRGA